MGIAMYHFAAAGGLRRLKAVPGLPWSKGKVFSRKPEGKA
jgi:hypothetical protein